MRAWLCAAAIGITGSVSVSAQAPEPRLDSYDAAVRAYAQGGDITEAVMPLQGFTRKHFDAAIDRVIVGQDYRFAETAALFQLEVGIGVIALSSAAAAGQFDLGERLLKSTLPPPSLRDGETMRKLHDMWATWFGVAGSGFLAVNDPSRARPWINKGLRLRPQSASLRTLLGAAHELDAASWNPDFWTTTSQKTRALMQRNRRLLTAEQTFRNALQTDPAYTLAEIRLGRVLFLLGEITEARAALERGEARALEPAHRYLAALFLGAVYQQQKDTNAARAAFERALAVVPFSQTAVVALGYLDLVNGRPNRTQELVRSFAASTAEDRYWWAYKNGGLDDTGLAWLRKRVRK